MEKKKVAKIDSTMEVLMEELPSKGNIDDVFLSQKELSMPVIESF